MNNTVNYCTLFDSHYLIRGIALYKSLLMSGDNFHLYVFALDKRCETILNEFFTDNITIIGIDEFENTVLLKLKNERSVAEYCWTCTSFSIEYVLDKYKLNEVTYLDADLYFFRKPSILINEFRSSNNDVMLMEHRYADDCIYKENMYGKYNVEFMTFRNTENGRNILKWWKEKCQEWCYSRVEEGRFGDQKYLDYFGTYFSGNYVCANIGGGVAPWNIRQYSVTNSEDGPLIDGEPVIFYHFHELKWYGSDYDPGNGYGLFSESVIDYLYKPYIKILSECADLIRGLFPDFAYMYDERKKNKADFFETIYIENDEVRNLLDSVNIYKKPIYIWGAGVNGKKVYDFFETHGLNMLGFVDRNYMNFSDSEFNVENVTVLKDKDFFVIVSPLNYREGILSQLSNWGYKENIDYITYETLINEIEKSVRM